MVITWFNNCFVLKDNCEREFFFFIINFFLKLYIDKECNMKI